MKLPHLLLLISANLILAGCANTHEYQNPSEPLSLNDIDLKWRARGLQAKEKLEKISAKKKKSPFDICSESFEAGFAEHASHEMPKHLKTDIDGYKIYALRISTPLDPKLSKNEDTQGITGIVFAYDKTGTIQLTSLPEVSKEASITFIKDTNGFILRSGHCDYFIYPEDPFKSSVREK